MIKVLTKYEISVSCSGKTQSIVSIQENSDGTIHVEHSQWAMTPAEAATYFSNLAKQIKKEFNVK